MAYFSNGTEGLMYQERYCFKGADGNYCINFKDRGDGLGLGCPVWDVHIFFNGNEEYADICNHLIPQVRCWKKGYDLVQNGRCAYLDKKLDIDTDEVVNMMLDDWKQLERGDADVQLRLFPEKARV